MFSHSYIFGRSYNSFKNFLKIDTYESFPILSILLTDLENSLIKLVSIMTKNDAVLVNQVFFIFNRPHFRGQQ